MNDKAIWKAIDLIDHNLDRGDYVTAYRVLADLGEDLDGRPEYERCFAAIENAGIDLKQAINRAVEGKSREEIDPKLSHCETFLSNAKDELDYNPDMPT